MMRARRKRSGKRGGGKKREWGEMSANEMSTARAVLFRQELVLEVCIHLLWHVPSLDNKLSV